MSTHITSFQHGDDFPILDAQLPLREKKKKKIIYTHFVTIATHVQRYHSFTIALFYFCNLHLRLLLAFCLPPTHRHSTFPSSSPASVQHYLVTLCPSMLQALKLITELWFIEEYCGHTLGVDGYSCFTRALSSLTVIPLLDNLFFFFLPKNFFIIHHGSLRHHFVFLFVLFTFLFFSTN